MTTENIVDNELSGTVHELPAVLREMADYRIKSNREMRHLLDCEPHEELGVRSLLKAAYVLERQREAVQFPRCDECPRPGHFHGKACWVFADDAKESD